MLKAAGISADLGLVRPLCAEGPRRIISASNACIAARTLIGALLLLAIGVPGAHANIVAHAAHTRGSDAAVRSRQDSTASRSGTPHQVEQQTRVKRAISSGVRRRGRRVQAAIVGGLGATRGSWPWVAYIQAQTGPRSGIACTGTVVAPNVVLSAAHCAEDTSTGIPYPPSAYAVHTGSVDLLDPTSGQVLAVSRVIIYPFYNRTTHSGGDAALLVLNEPTAAPAIPLATAADSSLFSPGTPGYIAGWGQTYGGDPNPPTQLQTAVTSVQSPTLCAQGLAVITGASFDPGSEICAIDPPSYAVGTCHGDSGGPMLARRADGSWVQIGITSWGESGCSTSIPDVFTRVPAVSAWVSSWVAALHPPALPPPAPSPPAPSPPAPAPAPPAPTRPATPVATPAPTPAPKPVAVSPLDSWTLKTAWAKRDVRTALRDRFHVAVTHGHGYRATCRRDTRLQLSCNVAWRHGLDDYWGHITIFLKLDHNQVVWDHHMRIRRARDRCITAHPKRHCRVKLFNT